MQEIVFHTVGDSHAHEVTWGGVKIEGMTIVCHHIGPITCASFGMNRPSIYELGVKEEDWVCFCFGEIDCRDHIGKYKDNYREVIDRIVDNYFYTLRLIDVARVFVFNVVPANRQSTAVGAWENNEWPCVGTDEERREYVRYMNECFKNKCNDYGFTFFDVHDKYADESGYFNLKYRDHCVHINNPVFLTEFLTNEVNKWMPTQPTN